MTPNLFGVSFGLAGLAGSWRAAAHITSAPGWVAGALAVAATAAWFAVGAAWVAQLVGRPRSLSGELHDPVQGPFVSLLPIVGMLLALDLYPHERFTGQVLFGVFAAATLLLTAWLTGQWITDRVDLDALHPGYFLPTVAGALIAAQGAGQIGWPGPARALFGIGLLFWLLLGPLILARPIIRPPLPAALTPTLAIHVAPPALVGTAYLALTAGRFDALTWAMAGFTALMMLVQLRLIPLYRRAPFGPGWWSFTFAYAAAATFALRWIAHEHPPGAAAWAWTVLGLITVIIGAIAARTVLALARGQFLPHPATTAQGPPRPRPEHDHAGGGYSAVADTTDGTTARRDG